MYFRYDIQPKSILTKGGNKLDYISLKVWSKNTLSQKTWIVAFTKSFNLQDENAEEDMFEFIEKIRKTYKVIPKST